LSIHTIIDGTALAASVAADSAAGHAPAFGLAGFGTFLVVVLHKPFDALSIAALMARGGWKPAARHAVNAGFAAMIPVGIALFWLGLSQLSISQSELVGCTLAFAAGNFLCIALADLLPELQFHHHDRLKLSVSLLTGVAMAYALMFLESSGHDHHRHPPAQSGHDHSHDH
jgi:zinc and cadmium transporter